MEPKLGRGPYKEKNDIPLKMWATAAALQTDRTGLMIILFPNTHLIVSSDPAKTLGNLRQAVHKSFHDPRSHIKKIFVQIKIVLKIKHGVEYLMACSASDFLKTLSDDFRVIVKRELIPKRMKAIQSTAADEVSEASQLTKVIDSEFPNHLDCIKELIGTTSRSLRILIDCVDYGSFSAPRRYKPLFDAVTTFLTEEKNRVSMLISGEPEPISKASPFYGKQFRELQKISGFNRALDDYCGRHAITSLPCNHGEFRKILQDQQWQSFETLLHTGPGKAKIKGLDGKEITRQSFYSRAPKQHKKPSSTSDCELFFWIGDKNRAVLLLCNSTPIAWQIGFETADKQVVAKLVHFFDKCWRLQPHASK